MGGHGGHQHQHQHHGHGGGAAGAHRGRLVAVLAATTVILTVEVVGGVVTGSLALLADAGHMATDAAGVALALLAMTFAARQATSRRTFGYYRLEILAAVVNAVVLFGVAAFVLIEAARRIADPSEVASAPMLAIAVVGVTANAISLLVLSGAQRDSLNIRGAYLEVLGDLLGSVAVIIAALVIGLTGFTAADPIASVVLALLILPRTYSLLRDAVDVLLEATPKNVDLDEVRRHIIALPGVIDVHDLHAWTITSGQPVLSAHVVVDGTGIACDGQAGVLDRLGECLAGHFDIEHCTFQLEPDGHAEHERAGHA